MLKNIDFPGYISLPQTIGELLTKCNKPTSAVELHEYPQEDILKLVEQGLLVKQGDCYTSTTSKNNELMFKFKTEMLKLHPVINFKKNILKLELSWVEYNSFLQDIANKYDVKNRKINNTPDDVVKLEYYIENILSMISQLRDYLKDNIVKAGEKNAITKNLVDEYSCYQDDYNALLQETIEVPEIIGFNDFIRNRMLHGGTMMFTLTGLLVPQESGIPKVVTKALCDYSMLESSHVLNKNKLTKVEQSVKNNLYKYYSDYSIEIMKLFAYKKWPWESFSDGMIDIVRSDLRIRLNDKTINPQSLDKEKIFSLLEDEKYVLFMYDIWKQRKIPSLGQFSFNIYDLLRNLYFAHMKLYLTLYDWVVKAKNKSIRGFIELQDALHKSSPEGVELGEKYTFKLDIKNK